MMRVILLLALNARVRYFVQLKRSRRGKVLKTRFALNIEGRRPIKPDQPELFSIDRMIECKNMY